MRVYADASILVALFTSDALTVRADRFAQSANPILVVSDFASVEVSSAVARKVRMGIMVEEKAQASFAKFDDWARSGAERVELSGGDILRGQQFVRLFALKLRTADAINLAVARRLQLPLATFDQGMASAAAELGVSVVAC